MKGGRGGSRWARRRAELGEDLSVVGAMGGVWWRIVRWEG